MLLFIQALSQEKNIFYCLDIVKARIKISMF